MVGYKFKITNDFLNNDLISYYSNNNLVAYKVPWNTCALWNYKLFNRYVIKFDEITAENPFNQICVSLEGKCNLTSHVGMEDGLAIAKAVSKNPKIKFKLLTKKLNWEIDSDNDKVKRHRQKLARKDIVLRNFMAVRNYSVEDLLSAEMK